MNKSYFFVIVLLGSLLLVTQANAAVTTPSEACAFYQTNYPSAAIERNTTNSCLIRVGDANTGFGSIHAHYVGTKFCIDSSGKFFGSTDFFNSSCVERAQLPQQPSTPGKLTPTPAFKIKELQYNHLPSGKAVTSGDDELVEITMPDGSRVQLDANSTFTPVSDHEVQSVFGRYRYMWQPFHDGKCIVGQNLVRQDCRKIKTRDAVVGITGTELLIDTDASGTTVSVLEGSVMVSDLNGKKTVEVAAGQYTYIKQGGVPDESKPYDPKDIDPWWLKKIPNALFKIF